MFPYICVANLNVELKVHHSLNSLSSIKNPVITTGTFDGVHLGHQKILNRLNELAKECNGESVLFTFYPHPRMVLFPNDHGLQLLNTIEEKKQLLEATGLDHLIVYPFSQEFSRLTALQYVRDLMVNQLNVHTMVVGYDHHFGRNREGNIELLREFADTYDFNVYEISALDIEEVNVSSTKIRTAISNGEIHKANDYLGHHYSFSGNVVKGAQRGRKLGFKTANIDVQDISKIIPSNGVYAAIAEHNGTQFKGMLNIGQNPTFNANTTTHIEIHLFDFDKDIYGEQLKVELVKKLRDERKFSSKEELVQQLNSDMRLSKELLE
ncbi:MAG: bifunctional riboflavin kinase/FAD synthetase [Flavobacteriales bacterium]